MPFTPLTDETEIASAFETLRANWKTGAQHFSRDISWRPATQTCDVWWRPHDAVWAVLELNPEQLNCYIFVGLDIVRNPLNIDCQFDVRTSGFSRRQGGVFLRDADGGVYIGHTGLIGGGVHGVGRSNFIAYAGEQAVSIVWPDDKVTQGFAISEIHSPTLAASLRDFSQLKLDFKASVKT